jgi:hypothetical protein
MSEKESDYHFWREKIENSSNPADTLFDSLQDLCYVLLDLRFTRKDEHDLRVEYRIINDANIELSKLCMKKGK